MTAIIDSWSGLPRGRFKCGRSFYCQGHTGSGKRGVRCAPGGELRCRSRWFHRSSLGSFEMTPAARLSSAIEVLETIETQRIPAAQALKEWGTSHRFAGSGDRAAISGLLWDVLRRYASSAWIMDDDSPRARLLGMLKLERGMDVSQVAALCDGGRFAPE